MGLGGWMKPKRKVFKFNLEGSFLEEYISVREAGRQNKLHDSTIVNCCAGRQKSAGGFIWKYHKT